MKRAEWTKLGRSVLSSADGWSVSKGIFFQEPVSWVLFGTDSDSSAWDQGVYVLKLRVPLFVPFDALDLTWSTRMAGGIRFDREDVQGISAAIREATLPQSQDDALNFWAYVSSYNPAGGEDQPELAAYARILLGDLDGAGTMLRALRSYLDSTQDWVVEMGVRGAKIEHLLEVGGIDAATAQLAEWARYTAGNYGIPVNIRL